MHMEVLGENKHNICMVDHCVRTKDGKIKCGFNYVSVLSRQTTYSYVGTLVSQGFTVM